MTGGDTSHAETDRHVARVRDWLRRPEQEPWVTPMQRSLVTLDDRLAAERAARQQAEEALRRIAVGKHGGYQTVEEFAADALRARVPCRVCGGDPPGRCEGCDGVGYVAALAADGPEATP